MEISHDRKANKLWLSQGKYTRKVLETMQSRLILHLEVTSILAPSNVLQMRKEKEDMNKVPYASTIGSLMYVMVCTRPNIAQVVCLASKFLVNPNKEDWTVVKWILQYLRGTSSLCLCFGDGKPVLEGYTDANKHG